MAQSVRADSEKIWTYANIITVVRICLVPVFVLVLLSPWPQWLGLEFIDAHAKSLIAAGVFILISCTDWVDGYLARSRNEVTDFGKFMDPLADKILVAAALLALVELKVLPSWPVLIILCREFIVSGIRMIAASKGEVIAASWYGKAKTVSQILAIILFIVKDSLVLPTFGSVMANPLYIASWLVMIVALVLTIVSMLDYLAKARHLIGFGKEAKDAAGTGVATDPGSSAKVGEPSLAALNERVSTLAQRCVHEAASCGLTVGTAESLTGGLIASSLTSVPGSSSVVKGGVVSYVNEVKHALLGVSETMLETEGAVNEQTAREMSQGAARSLACDVAVAVTGIAGPGGAEPGKPVGTVWVATCTRGITETHECHFSGDREAVRLQTVVFALDAIERCIKACV